MQRSIPNSRAVEILRNDDENATTRTIRGYGAVFYDPANPDTEFRFGVDNQFGERLMPSAFDGLDMSDVRSMFNHDKGFLLGRTPNTMRIGIDSTGVWYEADLDTNISTHRDVFLQIERGDVDGSSFWFSIADQGEKTRMEDERTIFEIHKLRSLTEMGPVVMPAYLATTASARCDDAVKKRSALTTELQRQAQVDDLVSAQKHSDELRTRHLQLFTETGLMLNSLETSDLEETS